MLSAMFQQKTQQSVRIKPMRYAIQRLRGYDYVPSIGRQLHPIPEIRYYDADSEKDARDMNLKENGFDWQYTVIKPAFEPGDYIGNRDDTCYLIEEINDKMMIIYNAITGTRSTEYIDYVKWHLLRKNHHEDIKNYPIGSQWSCLKESGLVNRQDIVTITDYALSEGVFWVRCERNKFCKFITRTDDLVSLEKLR